MFKHADPSRRTPTYLQARTVENLVWQIKLATVAIAAIMVHDWWEDHEYEIKRKLKNKRNKTKKS